MVALQPPKLEQLGLYVPHPAAVRQAFLLTVMFGNYSPYNADYLIQGRRTHAGLADDRGSWINLPLSDHFPLRHSITTMQLYAPFLTTIHGDVGRQHAWAVLSRKIRANHNRLDPAHPVAQIRLFAVKWPKDRRGFRAGKVPNKTKTYLWFTEAPE
jgi:hypothetical protein